MAWAKLGCCLLLPGALTLAVYAAKQRNFRVLEERSVSAPSQLQRMEWRIEQAALQPDGYWRIDGWVFEHDTAQPKWLQAKVVLQPMVPGPAAGRLLELRTNLVLRRDITSYVGDGADYRYSGFTTEIAARHLQPGRYRVLLTAERSGEHFLIDTATVLDTGGAGGP